MCYVGVSCKYILESRDGCVGVTVHHRSELTTVLSHLFTGASTLALHVPILPYQPRLPSYHPLYLNHHPGFSPLYIIFVRKKKSFLPKKPSTFFYWVIGSFCQDLLWSMWWWSRLRSLLFGPNLDLQTSQYNPVLNSVTILVFRQLCCILLLKSSHASVPGRWNGSKDIPSFSELWDGSRDILSFSEHFIFFILPTRFCPLVLINIQCFVFHSLINLWFKKKEVVSIQVYILKMLIMHSIKCHY